MTQLPERSDSFCRLILFGGVDEDFGEVDLTAFGAAV